MENQFKKLRQYSNALMEQKHPLSKTFEGALFSSSGWFLFTEETTIETSQEVKTAAPVAAATAVTPAAPVADIVISGDYLCDVLFVGDTYDGTGEDLLGKMIVAMKLKGEEFFRIPLDAELDEVEDLAGNFENPNPATLKLIEEIKIKKPKVVVCLGATITNILLGKREKLSGIHGQFFDRTINNVNFLILPVFHPEFLLINPNMKRTAWIDLQKVMARVGKI